MLNLSFCGSLCKQRRNKDNLESFRKLATWNGLFKHLAKPGQRMLELHAPDLLRQR